MRNYLLKRLLMMIPILLGITIISFILMNLAPGDPALQYWDFEKGPPSPEDLAEIRQKLGLDKPIYIRYFIWLKDILKGDMGYSMLSRRPISWEIAQRIGPTMLLSFLSMAVSLVFGLLLGVFSALNQYKLSDYILSILAFIGLSIPGFWLAIMLILLFTNTLGWLPSVGLSDVNLPADAGFLVRLWDYIKHLIMPVLAMSIGSIGSWARYQRSAFLETINQDYIRTARAKGLSNNTINWKHAMRNSCLPIVTILGMSLPGLVGGAFLIESIFGIPGLGRFGTNSIMGRDYNAVMGTTLMTSILVLIAMFMTDILYSLIDPRIRLK